MDAWLRPRTLTQRLGWAGLLLALGGGLYSVRFFERVLTTTQPRDFAQEWRSVRNYFERRPIYENQETRLAHHRGYRGRPGEPALEVNAHPPVSVLLTLPVAALDYPHALLTWNLLSLAALALSLWLLARGLRLPLFGWSLL